MTPPTGPPYPNHDPRCPYQRLDGSRCECGTAEREWREHRQRQERVATLQRSTRRHALLSGLLAVAVILAFLAYTLARYA